MANYSALDDSASLGTPSLVTDPLLAPRYTPGLTPEDENLDYWNRYKRETGVANPRDEVVNPPNAYRGYDPEDIIQPVWTGKQPAQPGAVPDPSHPDYEGMVPRSYGRNEPVSDMPPQGPPTYWEHAFIPDRELIAARARQSPSSALNDIPGGVPFPTQARPDAPPIKWTMDRPTDPTQPDKFGSTSYGPGSPLGKGPPSTPMPADIPPPRNPDIPASSKAVGPRTARRPTHAPPEDLQLAAPPPQTPSATAADRAQELKAQADAATAKAMETVHKDYPIVKEQELATVPGNKLEYWPPNEPGTPEAPRPASIPMAQAGMEIPPNTPPLDILGDIVSHHMIKKDPVIKKYYEGFVNSLTPDQRQHLQAQYFYYQKNEGEKRPYKDWEKTAGLPAYFRGYAFGQWPEEFNRQAYTPAQMKHLDNMMGYLRDWRPPQALQ